MKRISICDAHNDFLTELPIGEIGEYIGEIKNLGVKKVCASYWSSRKPEQEIEKDLDLRANEMRKSGETGLLHLEDLWWVKDEQKLKTLLRLKPFSCSLTWNDQNCLAGGSKSDGELTSFGRRCTQKLLENGIAVDLAHLNEKSFWQVAEIVKDNLYCSHTGFCGMKKHPRNLTDEQIDAVVQSGGFVGLFFFDECIKMNEEFEICDIVQNLKYFVSHWGCDHIGFGTDFYGIEKHPLELEDYAGFEKLFLAMKESGFSENQIDKIFWKNFLRFLSRVQAV